MKLLTPEAAYKARGLAKTSKALNDAFYAYLDRGRTHEVISAVTRPDDQSRIHATVRAQMKGAPSGITETVAVIELDRATWNRLPEGQPGPIKSRRRVDREVLTNESLWPRWPRLWLIRDPGTDSRVIDGVRQAIPDHGYLRAAGIQRGDREQSNRPRGGGIRVFRDQYDDCDYADANAVLADGWKVAVRQ